VTILESTSVANGLTPPLLYLEDELLAIKASLPQGVSATLVPGNIAFHSSRVQPGE
jgi:hypothetical protein